MSLGKDTTLQSDQAINIALLELNGFILTLDGAETDLTVEESLIIDESTEGISTGEADIILKSALTMSDGLLRSAGGSIKFASNQTSRFSGNAVMILDGTLITSDNGTAIAIIEIDGEPHLSMTDESTVSNITLITTANTVVAISTSGGVECLQNCTGFIETGAYGYNIHGVYRYVTSANWVLSEAEGPRKTA